MMTVKITRMLLIEAVLTAAGIWMAGVGCGYLRAIHQMEPQVKALGADVDRMAAHVDELAGACPH